MMINIICNLCHIFAFYFLTALTLEYLNHLRTDSKILDLRLDVFTIIRARRFTSFVGINYKNSNISALYIFLLNSREILNNIYKLLLKHIRNRGSHWYNYWVQWHIWGVDLIKQTAIASSVEFWCLPRYDSFLGNSFTSIYKIVNVITS